MNNQIKPSDIIVLEWTFSPSDFFEETISIERNDYEMIIEKGRVTAKIRLEVFENNPTMKNELTNSLNDRFLGVQLLSTEAYHLLLFFGLIRPNFSDYSDPFELA